MRTLSDREATIIIGLLVEQLGGEAILTVEQVARFDGEVESTFDPITMKTKIRARRKPETIPGEIVTAPTQSIESGAHQCEPWQKMRNIDGGEYCGACGATLKAAGERPPRIMTANGWIDCPPDPADA